MKFTVETDRTLIRAEDRSDRYVLVELTAPPSRTSATRPPINVALVLDRSGSMAGEKIALAREAVRQVLQMLTERDRFALVVYDDQIDVVMETTRATAAAGREAIERMSAIDARGTTDLASGWLRGAEQVALHLEREGLSRVLLLTDGLANVGIVDPEELERHARELLRRGVATSTFGVGLDFNDELLEAMAVAGGGNFYFVERAQQIPDVLASELGEILEIVARDVWAEIRVPEDVTAQTLTTSRPERRDGAWRFGLGDLVSGQTLDVLLHLNFPEGIAGHSVPARIAVVDRDGDGPAQQELRWEYASHEANDRQPRNRRVDRRVAAIYAARARKEAVQYNRQGDYEAARLVVTAVEQRIRQYAGDDAELQEIVSELAVEEAEIAAPLPESDRKQKHFAASSAMRSREPSGAARRDR